jgi:hypothetical protein
MVTARGLLKHLKEGLAAQIDGLDTKMGLRSSATDEKIELIEVKLSGIQKLILKTSQDAQERRQEVLDSFFCVSNISI